MSRPSATVKKPSPRPASRPSGNQSSGALPGSQNRSSINGGYQKATNRDLSRPSASQARPAGTGRTATTSRDQAVNKRTSEVINPRENRQISTTRNNTGNRANTASNNRVNIDNSRRGNTNINIDNSRNVNINRRNTYVRSSPRVYYRPPYVWGGFGFYCHSPYYFHPYTPFYWGPVWQPWGYFVATMVTTAIVVSIVNDSGDKEDYHYNDGNYYMKTENGYEVVQAPVGATVSEIPDTAQKVEVTENTYNYYYGGAYYERNAEGYTVVPATAGTIVPSLPEGGEEVKVGDRTYVKFGETYYQPIQVDGRNMYEIVEVKPES